MNMMKKCSAMIVLLMLSACIETLNKDLAIGGGLDLLKAVTVDDSAVIHMARLSANEMDSKNKTASPQSKYTQRLNRLFSRHQREDGLTLNYKVYMSDTFNAFAMPDGTVRVYSGLMDKLSDDEILAVIGHEIGHVKLHHSLRQYKKAYMASGLRKGMASLGGYGGQIVASQLGDIGQKFVSARFSQAYELEADKYGMSLMKRHHYNPQAMITAFQKMQKISGEGGGMLSSHPATSKRIEMMKAEL